MPLCSYPRSLLVEQRVERFPGVVRRLQFAGLVGGEIADDLRREEGALVLRVLAGNARRDVLAALPHGRGVEEAAVAAGVQVGAAAKASLVGGQIAEVLANVAALIALECLGAEAAGGASARSAFHALLARRQVGARSLRPRAARLGAVAAAVLISLMSVFTITQRGHLTKK